MLDFPANPLASTEKNNKNQKQEINTKIYNKPRLTVRKKACVRNTNYYNIK